jgi:hypothetical protein
MERNEKGGKFFMPEDIKKVIIVCAHFSGPSTSYQEFMGGISPAWKRFAEKGVRVGRLMTFGNRETTFASLLTGSSPETHGIEKAGGNCRAEYIWEAAQRSSKKTALFGFAVDRPPASGDPGGGSLAIASFLRTNPDWDLCCVLLKEEPGIDQAIAEILNTADAETLYVLIGLADREPEGFCAMAGAGVKKEALISRKVRIEDVIPTICYLAEIAIPVDCEGGIIYQALEDPDMKTKELKTCRRNYERIRRSSGPSAMC